MSAPEHTLFSVLLTTAMKILTVCCNCLLPTVLRTIKRCSPSLTGDPSLCCPTLSRSRRYNEVVEEVATDETDNYLDAEVQKKFNLTREVTNTTTWSSSQSFKVGGSLTFETGIPFTKTGGKYEINFEGGGSKKWGETEEKKQTVGQETTYPVRAMSRVKGSLMGTRLSYDIPFTYTQRDVMRDGSLKLTHKTDGVFTGHNGYGYRSQFVTLPLPAAASLGGGDDDIVRTG